MDGWWWATCASPRWSRPPIRTWRSTTWSPGSGRWSCHGWVTRPWRWLMTDAPLRMPWRGSRARSRTRDAKTPRSRGRSPTCAMRSMAEGRGRHPGPLHPSPALSAVRTIHPSTPSATTAGHFCSGRPAPHQPIHGHPRLFAVSRRLLRSARLQHMAPAPSGRCAPRPRPPLTHAGRSRGPGLPGDG
jgi:hypothetical protein